MTLSWWSCRKIVSVTLHYITYLGRCLGMCIGMCLGKCPGRCLGSYLGRFLGRCQGQDAILKGTKTTDVYELFLWMMKCLGNLVNQNCLWVWYAFFEHDGAILKKIRWDGLNRITLCRCKSCITEWNLGFEILHTHLYIRSKCCTFSVISKGWVLYVGIEMWWANLDLSHTILWSEHCRVYTVFFSYLQSSPNNIMWSLETYFGYTIITYHFKNCRQERNVSLEERFHVRYVWIESWRVI